MEGNHRAVTYEYLFDLKEAILKEIRPQNKERVTQKWLKSKDVSKLPRTKGYGTKNLFLFPINCITFT